MREQISYSAKIVNSHSSILHTVEYFQRAVTSLIDIVTSEWNNIEHDKLFSERTCVEKLIHSTKNNVAKYTFFDREFYKMPCYLRRSAQKAAIEAVKTFKNSKTERKTLCRHPNKLPCLYRGDQFNMLDDTHVEIKVFNGKDWVWEIFQLRRSDIEYIRRKDLNLEDAAAPVLKKSGRRWKLVFLFEQERELPEEIKRVCAVDLGVNNDAVCSVIEEDGTVKARRFINFADDKDRLYRILSNITYRQKLGSRKNRKLWRFANNANRQLAIDIARAIVEFASAQACDCIVFEHLDMQGKKKGSKKQRLALWRKSEIQRRVETMAHLKNMRLSRVFAKGTSMYAYDGSGKVTRFKENYSICEFSSGKQYNCDLSASYNIGARYFIRETQKTMSEKKWQSVVAKVPSLGSRTTCTLATLLTLRAVM